MSRLPNQPPEPTPPATNNGGSKIHETIANKGARHFLTESVATGQVERAKGIEPCLHLVMVKRSSQQEQFWMRG